MLKMLVDIDDGTRDGNTRVEAGTATTFLNEDGDGDGGMGDGKVDMADFRRFRDWVLEAVPEQFTEPANDERILLDGAADHPKRDLNGNGVTPASENALFEDENVFPPRRLQRRRAALPARHRLSPRLRRWCHRSRSLEATLR